MEKVYRGMVQNVGKKIFRNQFQSISKNNCEFGKINDINSVLNLKP